MQAISISSLPLKCIFKKHAYSTNVSCQFTEERASGNRNTGNPLSTQPVREQGATRPPSPAMAAVHTHEENTGQTYPGSPGAPLSLGSSWFSTRCGSSAWPDSGSHRVLLSPPIAIRCEPVEGPFRVQNPSSNHTLGCLSRSPTY